MGCFTLLLQLPALMESKTAMKLGLTVEVAMGALLAKPTSPAKLIPTASVSTVSTSPTMQQIQPPRCVLQVWMALTP
jgi:hypothetical protein